MKCLWEESNKFLKKVDIFTSLANARFNVTTFKRPLAARFAVRNFSPSKAGAALLRARAKQRSSRAGLSWREQEPSVQSEKTSAEHSVLKIQLIKWINL